MEHCASAHDLDGFVVQPHPGGDLDGVERHARRVALQVRILRLDGVDEGSDGVDQVTLEALAQHELLERDRRRLRESQQHVPLVRQESAVHRQAREAHDPHAPVDAGDRGRHDVQAVARPRQRDGLAPPGGDHAVEAQLQQAQQLADHGRRAGLRGGEVAVLVAQQQEAAVVLEALGGQAQRLLHERLRVEALQGEVADAEQHLDAGLPAVQLLGEP